MIFILFKVHAHSFNKATTNLEISLQTKHWTRWSNKRYVYWNKNNIHFKKNIYVLIIHFDAIEIHSWNKDKTCVNEVLISRSRPRCVNHAHTIRILFWTFSNCELSSLSFQFSVYFDWFSLCVVCASDQNDTVGNHYSLITVYLSRKILL